MGVERHGCVERHDDVIVVYEGATRLQWRHAADGFVLAGLGPDIDDLAEIGVQVARKRPLLVILEPAAAPIAVFESELVDIPPGVRVAAAGDGIIDLEVAVLDWLPEPLHGRGLRFLAAAAEAEADMPVHRLPPVLVDQPPPQQAHVRFARRTMTCPSWTPALLESLLTELFGRPLDAVAVA